MPGILRESSRCTINTGPTPTHTPFIHSLQWRFSVRKIRAFAADKGARRHSCRRRGMEEIPADSRWVRNLWAVEWGKIFNRTIIIIKNIYYYGTQWKCAAGCTLLVTAYHHLWARRSRPRCHVPICTQLGLFTPGASPGHDVPGGQMLTCVQLSHFPSSILFIS